MQSLVFTIIIYLIALTTTNGRVLQLRLSAKNLPNFDIFDGAPDPYLIIHYSGSLHEPFIRFGETEYQSDVNDVIWPEVFNINYIETGSQQRIKLDVMDSDIDEDDNIGYVEIPLSQIASSFGMTVEEQIIPVGNGVLKVSGKWETNIHN